MAKKTPEDIFFASKMVDRKLPKRLRRISWEWISEFMGWGKDGLPRKGRKA